MINVQNLQKSFGPVQALKNVNFTVPHGEVVGLLGPNGAGKSTTMRIIVGFLNADHGNVVINNETMTQENVELRRFIGYLPENAPLYADYEVTDYLKYIARLRGIGKKQLSARIREMIGVCGLQDVIGRKISKLSKGYRQRVGLAQALIHEPKILILDEPSSGLDPNQIVQMRELIKDIGKERTVILSTHILQEVEATCSRALILHQGQLVSDFTLESLQRKHVTLESVFRELTT